MMLDRRSFLAGLGAATLAGRCAESRAGAPPALTRVNKSWVVSEEEAVAWHRVKDSHGPVLTGNAAWHRFMSFLETKLAEHGCVDIHRSSWMFRRLQTSTWPDDSKWSLISNDRPVPLANFGANCGLTGPGGITAPLVLWDSANPTDVAGKIVVYRPVPRPHVREPFSNSDYEHMTPFDSYPVEGRRADQAQNGTGSIAAAVWDEMTSSSNFIARIAEAKPAGVIFALNLNRAAAAGLYTFRVPEHYSFPSVYVDRENGDAVISDARAQRAATLRVIGEHVQSEAYQVIAYLPGKNYATDNDQHVWLRTHTDGPSISQDNGALGLLGVIKYLSRIPRHDRPRTLMIEFDCRHFMPGSERAWAHEDYFHKHPRARDRLIALIAMEHLGQIEYVADGDGIEPSGRSLPTWIYASNNRRMIDYAYQAARANEVRSAIIRSPGRPGVHGQSQGPWYGMSRQGQLLGLPTFGAQGDLGAYWAHSARIDRFDARSFVRQVATFCQLTGFLMESDVGLLRPSPVEPPPSTAFE